MALENEILVGRFARSLQKLLSIKGSPPTRQISGDISAQLPFFLGTEFRFLEGWNTFGGSCTVAASVGNLGFLQIRNTSNSNLLVAVTKMHVICAAADIPALGLVRPGVAQGSTQTALSFDARTGTGASTAPSSAVFTSGAVANPSAGGTTVDQFAAGVNSNWDVFFDPEQFPVLLPGDAWVLQSTTANQIFRAAIWWRERFLEESERTLTGIPG